MRERKLVRALITTISTYSHQPYFLGKIEKLYNQDGFLTRNSYSELNTHLLNLCHGVGLTKNEFLERFDAILNTYRFVKRLSLMPQRLLMFAQPHGFQPHEINPTEVPSGIVGKSLSNG